MNFQYGASCTIIHNQVIRVINTFFYAYTLQFSYTLHIINFKPQLLKGITILAGLKQIIRRTRDNDRNASIKGKKLC